ncbi:restriction endonuclease [Cetobacterium sp. 2A]|uniref:restriction endonuclease n=1 Tax=Cetobacterium sp. 2A TaxID=2754723 RepID=UPI00163CAE85|nr:restriction endonuclease [Cetobacterium sp. 2A]MBC2856985.1 restriction endonuclease [Cetobacterium sp. 2A]
MIPSYEELMLPLLESIKDGKIHSNEKIEKRLAKEFTLTAEEVQEFVSSKNKKRKFYDRINWAKTYLKKAQLIEGTDKRGEFKITKKGLEVLEEVPLTLDAKYLRKYPEFLNFQKIGKNDILKKNESKRVDTPIEGLEKIYELLNNELKDEMLERLKKINFYKFESIVIDLVVKMGYGGSKSEISQSLTKKSNDEGIDGIINEDRLGLDRIYLQAKRWNNTTVGRPEVQKFVGALAGKGAMKGIFITTSTFTKEAIHYCENLTSQKIVLIDGNKLVELMVEFNIGLYTEEIYEIKKVDLDYFLDE